MKRLLKKFEDIMVAVTFAEAGEYDEAKNILGHPADEKIEKVPQEAAETVWNGNQDPGRIEIHRGGFSHNNSNDFHSRSDAAWYTLWVLVRDIKNENTREKKYI